MHQPENTKVKPMLRPGHHVDEQTPVEWTDEDLENIKRGSSKEKPRRPQGEESQASQSDHQK